MPRLPKKETRQKPAMPATSGNGQTGEKRERSIEISRGENYATLYANHVACTITPWDFCFRFGLIQEATEDKLVLQEGLGIYMSPLHARAFFGLMQRQLKLYEEQYGPIPEPKGAGVRRLDE